MAVHTELEDTADLSAPISNSYAEHSVRDSPACRSLCAAQLNDPTPSLFRDKDAAGCKLAAPPRFRAKAGYGKITVRGFGRVNGQRMMAGFDYRGQNIWSNPAKGVLNGYGSVVSGFASIADAEAAARWRIMSGLVELSSAGGAADDFAVDVSQITVACELAHTPSVGSV